MSHRWRASSGRSEHLDRVEQDDVAIGCVSGELGRIGAAIDGAVRSPRETRQMKHPGQGRPAGCSAATKAGRWALGGYLQRERALPGTGKAEEHRHGRRRPREARLRGRWSAPTSDGTRLRPSWVAPLPRERCRPTAHHRAPMPPMRGNAGTRRGDGLPSPRLLGAAELQLAQIHMLDLHGWIVVLQETAVADPKSNTECYLGHRLRERMNLPKCAHLHRGVPSETWASRPGPRPDSAQDVISSSPR